MDEVALVARLERLGPVGRAGAGAELARLGDGAAGQFGAAIADVQQRTQYTALDVTVSSRATRWPGKDVSATKQGIRG